MIYKPFFRDDLGYKPMYTQPLYLEEVVVSPIYSEKEDYKIDKESLGYKPIYNITSEGDEIKLPKSKKESKLSFSFSSKEDFKNTMLPIYENVLLSKGLDPTFAKSLVAQDGLESAWGSKPSGDNNFGGIKGKGSLKKTREVINGVDVYINQEFKDFDSLEDYAKYKVNLLNSKRYKAFDGGLEDFSRRVASGGYATDPRYKEVLDRVISSVKRGGVLKASTGLPLRNSYNDEDRYDYSGSDYIPTGGRHWPSRNPDTGLILKHPDHETYYKTLQSDHQLGLRRFKDSFTGREYTFNELDSNTKGMMPGMEEIGYPEDLYTKDLKVYGNKLGLAKRYYNKLINLGAGDVQAAAMVGVFMQESGLDHDAVSSKGAKGIAQLLGDKYDKYQSWLNKNKKADTAENQIEWIWDYMATAKDDWHDYYLSLYGQSLKDFGDLSGDIKSKAISDWDKMKYSKYAEYNYDAFRDTFYDLGDVRDAVDMFTWTFERPGDMEANMGNRYAYAESLLNYFRYDE